MSESARNPFPPIGIRIRCVTGEDVWPHLDDLARLRIEVFREFPYLYDGDMEYERGYLRSYSRSPRSLFVLAEQDEGIVGVATGVPLQDEMVDVQRPFLQTGWDPVRIFYFGESVLRKSFRGQGIGAAFIHQREAYAHSLGGFSKVAFCAVQRPPHHPLRPVDYVPLDAFWERRGYVRQPHLKTTFSWRDLGDDEETRKPMVFWLKSLDPDYDLPEGEGYEHLYNRF